MIDDPMTWDKADLQWHVDNQVEESLHLDYKAAYSLQKTDGKRAEVGKDVSAFANSDGGTIIYGMGENPNDTRLPLAPKGVDPSVITKE